MWAILKSRDLKFGIFLVYASNDYKNRIELWKWMMELEDIAWVISGDFNMVERPKDKLGGSKFELKGEDCFFWNRMVGS